MDYEQIFLLGDDNFQVRRLLPLPSSDWRDFSQDWFCGCCEGHDLHRSSSPAAEPSDQTVTEERLRSGQGKSSGELNEATAPSSNKQLTGARLDPRKCGDVLYSAFAICLSSLNFGIRDFEDLKKSDHFQPASGSDAGAVECRKCGAELGFCDTKAQLLQFWHHAARVKHSENGTNFQPNALLAEIPDQPRFAAETFRRIVDGFVGESFGQSVKIHFTTKCRRLFVWILEPNLSFLSGHVSKQLTSCCLAESQGVKKVLFRLDSPDSGESDFSIQNVDVTENLLDAGLALLRDSQSSIEPTQRRDGDFEISLIV